MRLTSLSTIIALFLAVLLFAHGALAQDHDLVILNGRVMDPETDFDRIRNVGVKSGKIAVITKDAITGTEIIDASDHVVAPGFVDGHVHTTDSPLGQKAALRDGVTTTLDLEVGAHPVARWYDHMAGRSQTNYGTSASAVGARINVFNPAYDSETGGTGLDMFTGKVKSADYVTRRASAIERDQILEYVENGLKAGALGIGPPIGYMTRGFSSEEMVGMQKLAAKYGRFMHVHTRFSS